jgi:hypothetical protein
MGRSVSNRKRQGGNGEAYVLDDFDESRIVFVDQTGDSDTDLLSERETRLNLDLANLLCLRSEKS